MTCNALHKYHSIRSNPETFAVEPESARETMAAPGMCLLINLYIQK